MAGRRLPCVHSVRVSILALFLVDELVGPTPAEATDLDSPGGDTAGQTLWQKDLFQRVSQSAAKLSRDAEGPLLQRLDSPHFRAALAACCPSISGLAASELLRRLKAEFAVSEVASGFPSVEDQSSGGWDLTLADGYQMAYFGNQWQVRVAHNGSFHRGSGWFGTQDDVETRIYGLRPFSARGWPANMAEASERGPYCVVNRLRADAGSPLYGDVSAVFSPQRMRDIALLSAVDTGSFEAFCNGSMPGPWGPLEHNCSAFPWGPDHLGTMDNFNHVLLINDMYWNATHPASGKSTNVGPLVASFARMVSAPESQLHGWGRGYPLRGPDLIHYFEVVPAGMLRYPHDVKFLIGKFPVLFGTLEGAELQQWCLKQGWLLIWALGLNAGYDLNFFSAPFLKGTFPCNGRLLDPTVAVGTSAARNLSIGDSLALFEEAWLEAQRSRALATLRGRPISSSGWETLFHNLSSRLRPELRLEPLRAASCADRERCVGTDGLGRCVCYAAGRGAPGRGAPQLVV